MPLYTADGNRLSETEFDGLVTSTSTTVYTTTVDIFETYGYDSDPADDAFTSPDGYRLKYPAGTVLTADQKAALYLDATVASVSPATGGTAGGESVTITGTNFTIGSTVTFGGTAATGIVVASPTTIRCVTPAKTSGAVTVAVTTDAGTASKATAYTYA